MKPSFSVNTDINVNGAKIKTRTLRAHRSDKQPCRAKSNVLNVILTLFVFGTSALATTVAIIRTPTTIVVASDSMSVKYRSNPPEATYKTCKVTRFDNIFFASSGIGTNPETGFDVREIARASGPTGDSLNSLLRFETIFMPALSKELEYQRSIDQESYEKILRKAPSAVAFFSLEHGTIALHVRKYGYTGESIATRAIAGIDCPGPRNICPLVIGTTDVTIVVLGHADATFSFLAKGLPPKKSLEDVARELVQIEIDNERSVVGPPIDILRLDKTGFRWINRKPECEEKKETSKPNPTPTKRKRKPRSRHR